eukprot:g15863.t1
MLQCDRCRSLEARKRLKRTRRTTTSRLSQQFRPRADEPTFVILMLASGEAYLVKSRPSLQKGHNAEISLHEAMVSEFAASLAVRASQRAAGLGLFTTQRHKAGSLLLAVPAGRCTSPALRELQAASRGSERYQLRQALSSEAALKDVALPEAMPIGQEHAFGALLSDPRP